MIFRISLRLGCALATLLFTLAARAEVRLPGLFSDGMVLQQGMKVPVWGWAEEGEQVIVEFRGQRHTTRAKDGRWRVTLSRMKAGPEPAVLRVTGRNTIEIRDVLVGEVWVASGQSNMQWAMHQAHDPALDIANSANPLIRLFYVPRTKSDRPLEDVAAKWTACTPETVKDFSAVAYYFARELQRARKVPVGIIHTSWGGSPAEVWMRREVLAANPGYQRDILDVYPRSAEAYQRAKAKYDAQVAEAKAAGKPLTGLQPPRAPWQPSELYNGMIAPLIPFAIRGAIWYQGESNAGRAHQYRTLLADMITNWRQDWGQGDFPFLQVQLAPYDKRKQRPLAEITARPEDSDWAELREAQLLATRKLRNVGMAVITDVGEKDDIHPGRKQPVGERLALAARGIAYGEKITWSGPLYRSMKVKGGQAILSFDHVGGGLVARDGELTGFAIAGEDRKFVWAKAEIQGDKVVVMSSEVARPVAVRYGWSDFPVVNLWNKAGLPASPFRTDDFPMITAPKEAVARK